MSSTRFYFLLLAAIFFFAPNSTLAAAYFGTTDGNTIKYLPAFYNDTHTNGGFWAQNYAGRPYYDIATINRVCYDYAPQSYPVSYSLARPYVSPHDNYIFWWNSSTKKWVLLSAVGYNNSIGTISCYAPTPTCTVTFDKNPINYGTQTILRWSSTYAAKVYIYNVGWVGTSGAKWVNPTVTTNYACYANGSGGNSATKSNWLYVTPPPTCTVSVAQNPIQYGGSTVLSWSSANATSTYINNVGYVISNVSGSATVSPSATTDYSCAVTGTNLKGSQSLSLTVTPPPTPAASISAQSSSIPVGSSTAITATFAAGSGDMLTHDNIDSPTGTGLGTSTNPDASKTITFAPSSVGSYTFYARAQTNYYPPWTSYANTTVTVTAAPSCTVSFESNPIAQGQSTTIHWSSANASSFSINSIGSVTPNTSGSAAITPSQSTDYTGTVSGGGVSNTCKAPTGNPLGTLNVSCTPSYSCSGQTVQYTDSSCQIETITTCQSPQFCSGGACILPPPPTGELSAVPNLVPQGGTARLHWNVANADSCSVTGTNGDLWSAVASPQSGYQTSPIMTATTYTLSCTGGGGELEETVTVRMIPSWLEV